jgi:ubiquinone/menaquinone biosynthesis C-methylase UbiE
MSSRDKYEKPKPLDYYKGDIAKNYEAYRKPKATWGLEHKAVENYIYRQSDIESVLDVPFGTGRFVPIYLKKQLEIHGVEISIDMINVAKNILKENFLKCNVLAANSVKMPYKDNSFDLLVCARFITAIIPFGDVKASLREFVRVTKKYMILEIGHRNTKLPRSRLPMDNEKMAYWFYPDEIKEMLWNMGIEDIESVPVAADQYIHWCKRHG